ncbi:MAG TPA: copper homeostasis protein CutC [Bacteroidales bacterium]|nr:copper homeostasis protein CutC [Bacteroidales bacterium]
MISGERKIEICCDSIRSAITAMNAGADRIELCDNLIEGGTTPSYGTIAIVRDAINIKLHVLIRPRAGDFLYDDGEYEIMKKDIDICKKSGVDGVVTGMLNKNGSIDRKRTKELVEIAYPMSVTFHRAFDLCRDPYSSIEDIISCGADRILTSGQHNKALDGTELISTLVKIAAGRIIIMPGSGLDESNIKEIAVRTGASEFHLTGRKTIDSAMEFRRDGIQMGGIPGIAEYSRKVADQELIRRIINILKNL